MTETMTTDRAATTRSSGLLTTPAGWFVAFAACIAVVLFIAALSFMFGVKTAHREIAGTQNKLRTFRRMIANLTD